MEYDITERTVDVLATTTIMPERRYGGWVAANTGTTAAKVLGYELQPGEAFDMRDSVPAGSTYKSPIRIEVPAGGCVRITRLQATPSKEDRK